MRGCVLCLPLACFQNTPSRIYTLLFFIINAPPEIALAPSCFSLQVAGAAFSYIANSPELGVISASAAAAEFALAEKALRRLPILLSIQKSMELSRKHVADGFES